MRMKIADLKRALYEVKEFCSWREVSKDYPCHGCPFNKEHCRIDNPPEFWDVDEWKEDSNATD